MSTMTTIVAPIERQRDLDHIERLRQRQSRAYTDMLDAIAAYNVITAELQAAVYDVSDRIVCALDEMSS